MKVNIKLVLKWALGLILGLVLVVSIYMGLPQVYGPSPEYQTESEYGEVLSEEVQSILTPSKEPVRTRSVIVMQGEQIVYEYGPSDKIMNGHSMRKAVMSLLYGIAVEQGLIDISKTLAELEIDEHIPLTSQEKSATIRDLLMFRSGIFLPAAGEHDDQITKRPKRDQYKPGEYPFSNNFDANALGTIFIQETGYGIGVFMEKYLAAPLGMQDFTADNVIMGSPWFRPKSPSHHQMYNIYTSARDFARIGAMVANNGRWKNQQVVSEHWIRESTYPHSDLSNNHINYGRYEAFGYIWMIDKDSQTVWTDGYGGHFMMIDMKRNLTLVERNFTGNSYLSTGLWMVKKNRDMGLANLIKAHELLAQNIDAQMNVSEYKEVKSLE